MKHQGSKNSIIRLSIFLLSLQIVFVSSSLSSSSSSSSLSSLSLTKGLDLMDLNGYKCFGVTKMDTPIRITPSGGIECFSTDGRVCANYFKHDVACRQFVAKYKKQSNPIQCNKYDLKDKKHWCYKAKKFFFKKWHCPDETGLSVAIKFSKKMKLKCMSSKDGKKCLKGKAAMNRCKSVNYCLKLIKRI